MRRRDFIALVGGAAAAGPPKAGAQQAAMPVIGFLNPASLEARRDLIAAFHQGLAEAERIRSQQLRVHILPAMFGDALGQWWDLLSKSVVCAVSSPDDLCSTDKALTSFWTRPQDTSCRGRPPAGNQGAASCH